MAIIDSGFPMCTLPISITICGLSSSSSSSSSLSSSLSTSYCVDPNKDDENNFKFIHVFTFSVFSFLSLSESSTYSNEILKGQSRMIASECKGELSSEEFIKSSTIAMDSCETLAIFIRKTVENHLENN